VRFQYFIFLVSLGCDSERLHWRQGFHSHQAFVNPPLEHLLEVVYNMLSLIVFGNSDQDEFASLPPIIPEGPIAILGRRNSSSDPSRALAISETRRLGN
jgi:hypothetical protein